MGTTTTTTTATITTTTTTTDRNNNKNSNNNNNNNNNRSPWDEGRLLLAPLFSSRLATLEDACKKMDGVKRVKLLKCVKFD